MLFFYECLSKQGVRMGVYTDTDPFVAAYAITPNEISLTGVYVKTSAVSAGIGPANPAVISMEFSPDGGATWRTVSPIAAEPIETAGLFLASVSGSQLVGPLIRVTVTVPAGETITISEVGVRRIRPGMVATLMGSPTGLGDVGIQYLRGPGGVYAATKPTYDLTTPANNRPLPVTLVQDAGEELVASSLAGVLTIAEPMVGAVTHSAINGWDIFTTSRAELGVTRIGKGGVPPDSAAMDCLQYSFNSTLSAWVYEAVDVLDHSTPYVQLNPTATARHVLATVTLWDGVSRQELVAENVNVAALHTLTETPTKALPTVSVMMGWDVGLSVHSEAEIWTLGAARYDVAGGRFLATSPMIGWDETNLDHREAKLNEEGNITTNIRWDRDGSEQEVVEDTGTPAANRPLPVQPMANNPVAGGFTALECSENRYLKTQESALVGGTLYHDYVATPVTTLAWQELDPGIGNDVAKMEIFDSSGELLELGLGAAGAEARHIFIMPGGNGPTIVNIPTGTRIAIRAVSDTANSGFIAINWYRG